VKPLEKKTRAKVRAKNVLAKKRENVRWKKTRAKNALAFSGVKLEKTGAAGGQALQPHGPPPEPPQTPHESVVALPWQVPAQSCHGQHGTLQPQPASYAPPLQVPAQSVVAPPLQVPAQSVVALPWQVPAQSCHGQHGTLQPQPSSYAPPLQVPGLIMDEGALEH
jgi:hypothetical protein